MGLLPMQTKPTPSAARTAKIALRRFPLGTGPKELPNQRKARFISSKHPLRQQKPITPSKRVKQEVKQEPVPPAPFTARKTSLDRTATKAAAKLAANKGQSKADAIVVEDFSPLMGKHATTPLTMQSLAAFNQAEAARQLAMHGHVFAEMPMFSGRVPPPVSAYYNAPQDLPTYPDQRVYPPIAVESSRKPHEYDGQGRRVPPPAPEPRAPSRADKARRADLAAQARLDLGLDGPPSSAYLSTHPRFPQGAPQQSRDIHSRQLGHSGQQSPHHVAHSDQRMAPGPPAQSSGTRPREAAGVAAGGPSPYYYHEPNWGPQGPPYYGDMRAFSQQQLDTRAYHSKQQQQSQRQHAGHALHPAPQGADKTSVDRGKPELRHGPSMAQ